MTTDPDAYSPLPPDAPLLTVLSKLAAQLRAKTGKGPAFCAIPRKLALRLAAERAAAKQTILDEGFQRACLDARVPALLLALPVEEGGPAVPVVAIDMPAPLAAAWTRPLPRFAAHEGFEEHPVYAACPFSRKLWDAQEGGRIPQLCRKVLQFCHEHAQSQPAPVFLPVMEQWQNARPLQGEGQGHAEMLPEDPAIAWAAIEAGLEEHAGMIRQEMSRKGAYGMEFDGELDPGLVGKMKEAFASQFQALAEYGPHPLKPGWFALVATPFQVEGVE